MRTNDSFFLGSVVFVNLVSLSETYHRDIAARFELWAQFCRFCCSRFISLTSRYPIYVFFFLN